MIDAESIPSEAVLVAPPSCNYELIPDYSTHTGILLKATPASDHLYIIKVGKASFLVPRVVLTKGGRVDLAAWTGMEIEICRYGERVHARLVSVDEVRMRVWELEELIARHIREYPCNCEIPRLEAMKALGYSHGLDFNPQEFRKYSTAKAKRERALAAVVG